MREFKLIILIFSFFFPCLYFFYHLMFGFLWDSFTCSVYVPYFYVRFFNDVRPKEANPPFATEISHSFFKLLAKLSESFVFIYLGQALFTFKLVWCSGWGRFPPLPWRPNCPHTCKCCGLDVRRSVGGGPW